MFFGSSGTASATVTPPTSTTAASALTFGSSDSFIHASAASALSAPAGSAYASPNEGETPVDCAATCDSRSNTSSPSSFVVWDGSKPLTCAASVNEPTGSSG